MADISVIDGPVPVVHVLRAQARLDVAEPTARRVVGAEQVLQQRLHPAAGEQRRGIVAEHERARGMMTWPCATSMSR